MTLVIDSIHMPDFIDDVNSMADAHYREVHGTSQLGLKWDVYKQMYSMGLIEFFGVFDGLELVGYAGYIHAPHAQTSGCISAVCEAIYVKPEYRSGMTGAKVMKYAEEFLRTHTDVTHISINLPLEKSEAAMNRLGYIQKEVVYIKEI